MGNVKVALVQKFAGYCNKAGDHRGVVLLIGYRVD